jgi:hypothetical protein
LSVFLKFLNNVTTCASVRVILKRSASVRTSYALSAVLPALNWSLRYFYTAGARRMRALLLPPPPQIE